MVPLLGLPLLGSVATPPVLVVSQSGALGTYPDLQSAVAVATTGAVIEIHDGGLFEETVTLTEGVTVVGVGVRPVLRAAIPGDDEGVFRVDADGQDVLFENLAFDGDSGSDGDSDSRAFRIHRGRVRVVDCTFDHHTEASNGGTILSDSDVDTSLELVDSVFTDSTAGDDGGFVSMPNGTLIVTGCAFTDGQARDGGAIQMAAGSLTVTDSTFDGNVATESGGAIQNGGDLDVTDSWFRTNSAANAAGNGGAIAQDGASSTFTRVVLCDNRAGGEGGGLYLIDSSALVLNSVFLHNAADQGGAIGSVASSVQVIHGSVVANDSPALSGEGSMAIRDTYVGHHGPPGAAVSSNGVGDVSVAFDGFSDNTMDFDPRTDDLGSNQIDGANVPLPAVGSCDPLDLAPPAGSDLLNNASDGSDIGALDGVNTWIDGDGDGFLTLDDCDDGDPAIHPGAVEAPGDEVDQDCDGAELCYQDADVDEHGEAANPQPSIDDDCDDAGEYTTATDTCFGYDDDANLDGDAFPDGCDDCDLDPAPGDDTDDDDVCNADDICDGFDDQLDTDGDGTPNGCDDCSLGDSDGDGVADDCDLCPGGDDDADRDGDGNPDGCDPCPYDAPNDTDGDDVCDSDDQCPGFDDHADADQDSVADGCDECPGIVGDDSDLDGICDLDDPCPYDNPDDADGDGVCDSATPPRLASRELGAPRIGCGCGGGTGGWLLVLGALLISRRARG